MIVGLAGGRRRGRAGGGRGRGGRRARTGGRAAGGPRLVADDPELDALGVGRRGRLLGRAGRRPSWSRPRSPPEDDAPPPPDPPAAEPPAAALGGAAGRAGPAVAGGPAGRAEQRLDLALDRGVVGALQRAGLDEGRRAGYRWSTSTSAIGFSSSPKIAQSTRPPGPGRRPPRARTRAVATTSPPSRRRGGGSTTSAASRPGCGRWQGRGFGRHPGPPRAGASGRRGGIRRRCVGARGSSRGAIVSIVRLSSRRRGASSSSGRGVARSSESPTYRDRPPP